MFCFHLPLGSFDFDFKTDDNGGSQSATLDRSKLVYAAYNYTGDNVSDSRTGWFLKFNIGTDTNPQYVGLFCSFSIGSDYPSGGTAEQKLDYLWARLYSVNGTQQVVQEKVRDGSNNPAWIADSSMAGRLNTVQYDNQAPGVSYNSGSITIGGETITPSAFDTFSWYEQDGKFFVKYIPNGRTDKALIICVERKQYRHNKRSN